MQALAFPFRFNRGSAVVLDADSERYAAQRVASAASTRIEELPLLPRFGLEDPTFDEFDSGGLYFTCATYFPDILITDLFEQPLEDGRSSIEIQFEVRKEEPSYGIA